MTDSASARPPGESSGDEPARPSSWNDWYHFAADELGCLPEECVEYANLRFVEEQNRASLRDSDRPRARVGVVRRPGLRLG
jgi:hypothetical protein